MVRGDLNMMVAARGQERSLEEDRSWIGRFGYELEKVYPTPGGKHYLVARC